MVYALLLFITMANGQDAIHPVDYHFTLADCEKEGARLQSSVDTLKKSEGWQTAQLRCIPIPAAGAAI